MRLHLVFAIAVLALAAGCSSRFHPDNYSAGAIHGVALKTLSSDCRSCHGADLAGGTSKVSCDGCHSGATPTAWRTNCTFCHGGVNDNTGAPPRNLDGSTTGGSMPAHTPHVTGGAIASAYDCTQCHVKANDVLTPGHIFADAATLNPVGGAMNDFGAGLSPQGAFDRPSQTCSNLYCHGNGQGDNGTVTATAGAMTCTSCHAGQTSTATEWSNMSGPHAVHMTDPTGITCADCHNSTTTDNSTVQLALHLNGKIDVAVTPSATGFTVGPQPNTCTGTCHGFQHTNLTWVGGASGAYHPPGYQAANAHGTDMELLRQDCRQCHGTTLTGGMYGSLAAPSCDTCHSGATPTAWRSNCTFCHGNSAVSSNGMPPRDPGSSNTSVSQKFIAHSAHVTPTMMVANDCTTCHTKPTDVMSPHHAFDVTNGVNDVNLTLDGRNPMGTFVGNGTGNATCNNLYCHSNGQAGAVGSATDGSAAATCTTCHGGVNNNRTGLTGEHRNDHGGIACSTCHNATIATGNTGATAVSDVTKHINGTRDVVFDSAHPGTYDPTTKLCMPSCHGAHSW